MSPDRTGEDQQFFDPESGERMSVSEASALVLFGASDEAMADGSSGAGGGYELALVPCAHFVRPFIVAGNDDSGSER